MREKEGDLDGFVALSLITIVLAFGTAAAAAASECVDFCARCLCALFKLLLRRERCHCLYA